MDARSEAAVPKKPSAPVILFLCSDHRLSRSGDIAVIEVAVNWVCEERGFAEPGEELEFDTIQIPGPQMALSDRGMVNEASMLLQYIKTLMGLHGTQLVILTYHLGEQGDSGCGREGARHNDLQALQRHARCAVAEIRFEFPDVSIQVLEIRTRGGRTYSAKPVSLRAIGWVPPQNGEDESLDGPIVTRETISNESSSRT